MKYTVLATEHREGSFTAKSGKDAGQVKNYKKMPDRSKTTISSVCIA